MPNRLLPMRANRLRPQSDSRIACATVTLAGTPVVLRELCAAAPTVLMKSVPEANVCRSIRGVVAPTRDLASAGKGSGTGGVIGPMSARPTHAMPG